MRTRKRLAASAAAIVVGSTAGVAYAGTADRDAARLVRVSTGSLGPRADIATRAVSSTTTVAECTSATYNPGNSAATSPAIGSFNGSGFVTAVEQWLCVKNIGRFTLDVAFKTSTASSEDSTVGTDEALSDPTTAPGEPGELADALTIEAATTTVSRHRVARRVIGDDGLLEEVEVLEPGRAMLVRFRVIGPLHADGIPVSPEALEAAQTDQMQVGIQVLGDTTTLTPTEEGPTPTTDPPLPPA